MTYPIGVLKKMVAAWIRGWLPFVIVTKGGWAGFSCIQDAANFCGARGGGQVYIGPGTWNENINVTHDYVQLIGSGWGVTKIHGGSTGAGVKLTGDWGLLRDMTIDNSFGGGHAGAGAIHIIGSNCTCIRVESAESDNHGFYSITGSNLMIHNCRVVADNHDLYAMDLGQPNSIVTACYTAFGGSYNIVFEGTADHSVAVANVCNGNSNAVTYGIIFETGADNCVAAGNNVFDMSSTDIWDRAATGTVSANEIS